MGTPWASRLRYGIKDTAGVVESVAHLVGGAAWRVRLCDSLSTKRVLVRWLRHLGFCTALLPRDLQSC